MFDTILLFNTFYKKSTINLISLDLLQKLIEFLTFQNRVQL